jgi:6-phosphogluconate dehydrogenase
MTTLHDIALIGLGVMGHNLALNIAGQGFRVAVHDRSPAAVARCVAAVGDRAAGHATLAGLVAAADGQGRRAGGRRDRQLLPLLEPDDIVIDGGNSLFTDTERRDAWLTPLGLRFIGAGVSGGEEGARKGPAIMPGGPASTWAVMRPIFEAIAAKVDGEPCVIHIGPGGAGHYVKMVHNGIEYGDMQLICEAYALLQAAGLPTTRWPMSSSAGTRASCRAT